VLRVRCVLFATDFSDLSRPAGRTAAALARQFGARLLVVHVRPFVADGPDLPGLVAAVADLVPGLSVTTETLYGTPATEIVAYARRAGADIVVLGTHGRTGLSRALLGSVAEAVVRRAPCPVLTVGGAATGWTEDVAASDVRDKCVVCASATTDLICEQCRALIRTA
jgi:nucleotide-binding universal stress UspA family protein